ncbi:MAG: hypothetical protein PHI86_01655 [Candidatus Omnitrophica bacterium]|nr:hypothetical protein [Candidatus Omnitrophota bacterium]HOX53847.1 hypothetical protein [Candidatus Omnitrophota bacterium]
MKAIQILLCCLGIVIGLFVFLKPAIAIEMQRKFYAIINWRLEPISMEKEIKNTKLMGFGLFVVTVVAMVYALVK